MGQLSLLSGVVEGMTVHVSEEDFFHSAGQQALGAGVAVGLAASGLAGVAVGASMAAAGGGDAVEFFSCKVGDQVIKGRFSKASFKDGDDMQFVVQPSSTGALFGVAARRARDRVLWMEPHCSRGPRAHRNFCAGLVIRVGLSALLIFVSFVGLAWAFSSRPVGLSFIEMMLGVSAACSVLVAIYYPLRFHAQWLGSSRQAEAIFAVFGYSHPSLVDLPRDHKRYCKAKGIGWPYLIEGNGNWIYHYPDVRG